MWLGSTEAWVGFLILLLIDQLVQQGLLNARIEKELLNSEKICNICRGTETIMETFNLKHIYCQSLCNI